MPWAWLLLLALAPVGLGARLEMPQAVRLAQAYLGQALEPHKVELKRKEGTLVWEVRLGDWEVWVEAQRGQVSYLRAKKAPPHAARPHLPFLQAWRRAEEALGPLEKLELKPHPQGAYWEARGPRGKAYLLPDGRLVDRKP